MSQREYQRLKAALAPHRVETILFGVLTLDAEGRAGGQAAAYKSLKDRWEKLQRLIEERFGDVQYVTTLEQHANGWPHMNVVLVSPSLAAHLAKWPARPKHPGDKLAPRWWRDMVLRAGFGFRTSLERARSVEDVASYLSKTEVGTVASPTLEGEVVKTSQLPLAAPKRTRRIRSSRGFLAPVKRSGSDITGALLQVRVATVDAWAAEAQLERDAVGALVALGLAGLVDLEGPPPERREPDAGQLEADRTCLEDAMREMHRRRHRCEAIEPGRHTEGQSNLITAAMMGAWGRAQDKAEASPPRVLVPFVPFPLELQGVAP